MDEKIEKASSRLQMILPLQESQQNCSEEVRELHQEILRSFVRNGRILTRAEMAQYVRNLDEAVAILRQNDMVTFAADGEPVGAYPFTMEARAHQVWINGRKLYAMCALDALAVSPMFGMDTTIHSQCRVTGEPLTIQQSGTAVTNVDESGDIHFGIVWGAVDAEACCADTLCTEMIFLKDKETAQHWWMTDTVNREIFSLEEAVIFAEQFFAPLLAAPIAPADFPEV